MLEQSNAFVLPIGQNSRGPVPNLVSKSKVVLVVDDICFELEMRIHSINFMTTGS